MKQTNDNYPGSPNHAYNYKMYLSQLARYRTIEEILQEDEIRIGEHALENAFMEKYIIDEHKKMEMLKEKKQHIRNKREESKNPLTTCIIDYIRRCAEKHASLVISLEELFKIALTNNCICPRCEYIRRMKAAAAGAGHLLKETHIVRFSPQDNTIRLSSKCAA